MDSSKTSISIGVVGLVHGHAHQFFKQYKNHPEIQLVGIAEPDRQLAAQYSKEYALDPELFFGDVNQLLDKTRPAAVVLYTNTLDHRKMVEICASRGVHVMLEKPLAVSMADARAIQTAAARGKVHVLVNYETTWHPSVHAVNKLVQAGKLGELRKLVFHDGHFGPKEIGVGPEFMDWLGDPKRAGAGALFDFGCYGADLATWLLNGQRPLNVVAITQQIKPEMYPDVDDEATIILSYPKAQVIIQASWNWPYSRKDMEVYGTTGYAITTGMDQLRVREQKNSEDQRAVKPLASPMDHPLSMLKSVIMDGAGIDVLSSLETNMLVSEILQAAKKSAATGKMVKMIPTLNAKQ